MILDVLAILLGFLLLIFGSDKFIAGAVHIAEYFKISERWIGLTLIAFGTSLPELMVTGYAASHGSSDVALSNVLGSNVANIWLAFSVCALVSPPGNKNFKLSGEFWLTPIFAAILFGFLLFKGAPTQIPRLVPFAFIILTCLYLFFSGHSEEKADAAHPTISFPAWKTLLYVVIGLCGLLAGSKLIVDGVVRISEHLGLTQTLLGFSVVAVGTSLPEIASSVSATAKGKHDMAIANILGSNLINIGIVYGSTCFFDPVVLSNAIIPAFVAVLLSAFSVPMYVRAQAVKMHRIVSILFAFAYFVSLGFIMRG